MHACTYGMLQARSPRPPSSLFHIQDIDARRTDNTPVPKLRIVATTYVAGRVPCYVRMGVDEVCGQPPSSPWVWRRKADIVTPYQGWNPHRLATSRPNDQPQEATGRQSHYRIRTTTPRRRTDLQPGLRSCTLSCILNIPTSTHLYAYMYM